MLRNNRWLGVALVAAIAIISLVYLSVRRGRNESRMVGSQACAKCHASEFVAWSKSQHAVAMQVASSSTVLGRFDGISLSDAGLTSRFRREGNRFLVNTEGADGKLHDFEIRYTFGVYPLQQYLVQFPDGRLQPLPFAWDSRAASEGGQRWFHLQPGTRVAHTDELHWASRQMNWNFMCADCHSTGVKKGYDATTDRFRTTWSEINVGCEACHGPASRHLRWARYPKAIRGIAWRDDGLTASLTERRGVTWTIDNRTGSARRNVARRSDTEIETCAVCHSRRVQIAEGYFAGVRLLDYYVPSPFVAGLYYPDGQQRDEVYNYGSFLQSRMYHAGVTCADCHDPHTQKLRLTGNALCLQCHLAAKYDIRSHTLHQSNSRGSECVACHMPATKYMQIDARRDHSIRIPRPELTSSAGVPNACNSCHTEMRAPVSAAQIATRFAPAQKGFQKFTDAFVADDRNAPDAAQRLSEVVSDSTEPMIARASALARLAAHPGDAALSAARTGAGDSSPLVRRAALAILDAYPPHDRIDIATFLLTDPSRAVRIEAARLLAPVADSISESRRDAFAQASAEFVATQRYLADRPENRVALGIFLTQLGLGLEAATEYRAAMRIAPGFGPAYVNLADLMRAGGRDSEAQALLREGIVAAPADAAVHHALGLSLVRSGNLADAITELARASELAPEQPHFAYVYAVALNSGGRKREAMTVLAAAFARHPGDRDILFGLATFSRDNGDRIAAMRYAQMLSRYHPEDQSARALLQSLQPRAVRGRP